MAEANCLILYRNNIWPWGILWVTLCWPRSKVKVTVHTASTWVVDALKSLNLTEFQYNCTHMCIPWGARGSSKLGHLDLYSRSQEPIFQNGRKPVSQRHLMRTVLLCQNVPCNHRMKYQNHFTENRSLWPTFWVKMSFHHYNWNASHSNMARGNHLILSRNNTWPWDILWMTLYWPRSKVKVTVHIGSPKVVNTLRSLNLFEFQYICIHMYLSWRGCGS